MIANSEETHLAQRAFRQVMNAFARPGTVGSIEGYARLGDAPVLPSCFETALRLFVDQAVTFSVVGADAREQAEWITLQTHAHAVCPVEADFVLVPDAADAEARREAIAAAKAGSLVEPEGGATVIVACSAVSSDDAPGLARVDVEGPGVDGRASFYVDRIDWAQARADRADEYPCGIEIVLVDEDGNVVAIPRSTRVSPSDREGGASWDM